MAFIKGTAAGENLNGGAENDFILGLGGADVIDGGAGADRIYGGDGDDSLYDMAGGGAGDSLFGDAGDDILVVGDLDADTLDGGFGSDWFYVDGTTNTVVDLLNQNLNSGHAAGDRLRSIERFSGGTGNDRFLTSARNEDFYDSNGDDFYNGRTGTDIYRAVMPGVIATSIVFELAYGARAAQLAGLDGKTLSSGQSGVAAYIIWNDGNANGLIDPGERSFQIDELIGIEHYVSPGMGVNMAGSAANEVFYCQNVPHDVDGGDGNDFIAFSGLGFAGAMIVDLTAGSATDGAQTATLTAIESVLGSINGDDIRGNGLVNTLVAAAGDDLLDGRGGNDRLDGGDGIDLLVGGAGNDLLIGGALGDVLDGGDGIDTACWTGASGVVVQLGGTSAGSGEGDGDRLISIENAIGSQLEDTIRGDGVGNRIEGLRGSDYLYGGGGNDVLYGDRAPNSLIGEMVEGLDPAVKIGDGPVTEPEETYPYTNRLYGQSGDDSLIGGGGYDALYGGTGNDRLDPGTGESSNMYGGTGNDTYFVRGRNDNVRELEGEGVDRVFASTSFTIYSDQSIETLTLTGTRSTSGRGGDGAESITGNVGNNILAGNDGSDSLNGGAGNDDIAGGEGTDLLQGGAGREWFRFDTGIDGTVNVDTIEDFVVADDTILLDRAIFEAIASDGRIAAATFRTGTAAGDANDRILYDQGTGRIFYDADGNGLGAAAILFARVDAGTALTAADFVAITSTNEDMGGGGGPWVLN